MKSLLEGTTPGPWSQGIDGNNRVYGPDNSGPNSGLIAVVYKGRANVRLVAALPKIVHALVKLDEIIENSIVENDGPNRFWVDGVALEGPHADAVFRILRKIQQVCRKAIEP